MQKSCKTCELPALLQGVIGEAHVGAITGQWLNARLIMPETMSVWRGADSRGCTFPTCALGYLASGQL